MKSSLLVLMAILLPSLYVQALAQGQCPVPSNYGAVLIASDTVHATIPLVPLYETKGNRTAYWVVYTWLVSTGGVEYTVDPNSVSIVDSCSEAPTTSTHMLFDLIGIESVKRGIALGYDSCATSGSRSTAVSFASCVTRTGSGSSTAFSLHGTALARNGYSFTCSGGVPSVTSTGSQGCGGCGTGYESTCGGGAGIQ